MIFENCSARPEGKDFVFLIQFSDHRFGELTLRKGMNGDEVLQSIRELEQKVGGLIEEECQTHIK